MKKNILCLLAVCAACFNATAQTQSVYDALIASSNELNGTARFMSVGGAMGALGGDASTIFYNPAGIGIYKSSEFTVSLNVDWANTTLSDASNPTSGYETETNANLQHMAYVGTWNYEREKGLLNFNLGVAYNQSKKFEREGYYHGYQPHSYTQWIAAMTDGIPVGSLTEEYTYTNPAYSNNSIPWGSVLAFDSYLTDTKYQLKDDVYQSLYDWSGKGTVSKYLKFQEKGFSNDFALSLAGNFSNLIFWGMTFECDYASYSRHTTMQETFADGSTYSLINTYALDAIGFTYKIGLIIKPTSWLRIGGAFHTPTVYAIDDISTSRCIYSVYDLSGNKQYGDIETPYNVKGETKFTGPLKAIGSLGFVLGRYGFIGIDYQYENTSAINGNDGLIKEQYSNDLLDRHIIRAGIEIKPVSDLSLRLGAGYTTTAAGKNLSRGYYYNDMRTDTDYYNEKDSYNVTAGIGYRIGRHAIDLAYIWQVNNADYYPYSPSFTKYDGSQFNIDNFEPIGMRTVRNQIVATYSIRF